MKRTLVRKLAFGLFTLGLISCQRGGGLDVGMENFRAKADEQLARMAQNYSLAFAPATSSGRNAYNGTGYNYAIPGVGIPQGVPQASYTYSYPYEMNQNMVQFQSSPTVAGQQCHAMQAQIPKTAQTFAFAMITLARCLNRLIHERNQMLTWMYQQGSQFGQTAYTYGMNYGSMVPYQQYPYNNYGGLNNFAYNGWANTGSTYTYGGGVQ